MSESVSNLLAPLPNRDQALRLADEGRYAEATALLEQLLSYEGDQSLCALLQNDLGTLAALQGDLVSASAHFRQALLHDALCHAALENLQLLETEGSAEASCALDESAAHQGDGSRGTQVTESSPRQRTRVAILSMLFNWPSTGGGTIHTAELGKFLSQAGYDVRHIYAVQPDWGLGNVTEPTGVPSEPLHFSGSDWHAAEIQRRFREAVERFRPDSVIITDSWNFKPLLAEAVQGYRYFLRLAALECLCPLNNVRMLFNGPDEVSACPRHQLATPDLCRRCVQQRVRQSGSLHQAERQLSGYGTDVYDRRLKQAFAVAAGVLVVNPLVATMVSPYSQAVHVVPSGFDVNRFPRRDRPVRNGGPIRLFFAGLTEEWMKGFHILQAACEPLWQRRQDFELVATADAPAGPSLPFARFIGWQSQADLPKRLQKADILVFPTIAEEALGRSAVEAMAAGIPVIASRIGGLQFTVRDGATGLLFEPGNVPDLIKKIERLLDDASLRQRLGEEGRRQFEEHFTWDVILQRHYRSLLGPPVLAAAYG